MTPLVANLLTTFGTAARFALGGKKRSGPPPQFRSRDSVGVCGCDAGCKCKKREIDRIGGVWWEPIVPSLSVDGPRWLWVMVYDSPKGSPPPNGAFLGWIYCNETFLPFLETKRYRSLTSYQGTRGGWYRCEELALGLGGKLDARQPQTWVWADGRAGWEVVIELDAGGLRCEAVAHGAPGCGTAKFGSRPEDFTFWDLERWRRA